MEKIELDKIIQRLEGDNSIEDAFLGFHNLNEQVEYCIKANKSGLELYAARLLRASAETEEIVAHEEKSIYILEKENDVWIEGDISIEYVEPSLETRDKYVEPEHNSTWKEKLLFMGLAGIGIFLLFLIIVGLLSFIGWFF